MDTYSLNFDEQEVIPALKHYLPSQTPIKDFIHHNTLHAFQNMKFYDAIFKAGKIFGYQVTLQLSDYRKLYKQGRIKENVLERILHNKRGSEAATWKEKLLFKEYNEHVDCRIGQLRACWKQLYKFDLDLHVQPLLFRILASYLDQGVSQWKFPTDDIGFLSSVRAIEKNSFASFFKSKRARQLLLQDEVELTILLGLLVGNHAYFNQYLFDQQFSHQGWSGIVSAIEDAPHTLLDPRKISLQELIAFELLLEIDALDYYLGENWQPLATGVTVPPVDLFAGVEKTELQDVLILWQDAFEWSYYDEVLTAISLSSGLHDTAIGHKSFQAIFCIDERECSLRRHIEAADSNCETLGSPGFFGVEFYFQPENGKFYEKLCPAPVTPKYLVKESGSGHTRKHELLYSEKVNTLFTGFLSSITLGFYAGIRLFQNLLMPKMSPSISDAFGHMHSHSRLSIENKNINDTENGLQIGFTINEMASRVEMLLRSIGLVNNFAPIVYVVAHGSSSANNPHHSAHDCGACSGKPGSVNARVFAFMANHPQVREKLRSNGLIIPATTHFIGALHDTASDTVGFYDDESLSADTKGLHLKNKAVFENALDVNAKERSRRFAAIRAKNPIKKVRKAIFDRSASMFEPRPELGHGTNTLCIIGKREVTQKIFLDRRAFLNSYDYKTDPNGDLLVGVMRPIGLVCGGINLEYYFSRVDNYKLGSGTKLPHNVIGLLGVANSADGDLRPGLPLQMIEVHDPVRLLVIVHHYPEVILNAIKSSPEVYEWYANEWVHIVALNPKDNQCYRFVSGEFVLYQPTQQHLSSISDIDKLIDEAKEMETNYIVDATKENLPVYLLKK